MIENISLYRNSDLRYGLRRPGPVEGRFANVTTRWAGDAMAVAGSGATARFPKGIGPPLDVRLLRTAKSCGPGAATLASIPAGLCWRGNGGKRGRSPGRVRISRKAIAWGKPGCLGCTCQNRVHSTLRSAHGAAGAASARLSLRPLPRKRVKEMAKPGETIPREREALPERHANPTSQRAPIHARSAPRKPADRPARGHRRRLSPEPLTP
jgi:hypothetical protein